MLVDFLVYFIFCLVHHLVSYLVYYLVYLLVDFLVSFIFCLVHYWTSYLVYYLVYHLGTFCCSVAGRLKIFSRSCLCLRSAPLSLKTLIWQPATWRRRGVASPSVASPPPPVCSARSKVSVSALSFQA